MAMEMAVIVKGEKIALVRQVVIMKRERDARVDEIIVAATE
jgi:hypothetical protein